MPNLQYKNNQTSGKFRKLFDNDISDIWLEIGFGSGEHIKWQLDKNKDIGIIACEPYINGVANLIELLNEEQLQRVKIYMGDVRTIIDSIKNNSISKVFLLFPDPWPKKKHYKRRIIEKSLIDNISRILLCNGELRIASDHSDYITWILHQFLYNKNFIWNAKEKKDFLTKSENWPQTKYENKAKRLGKVCYFLQYYKLEKNN